MPFSVDHFKSHEVSFCPVSEDVTFDNDQLVMVVSTKLLLIVTFPF